MVSGSKHFFLLLLKVLNTLKKHFSYCLKYTTHLHNNCFLQVNNYFLNLRCSVISGVVGLRAYMLHN